MWNRDAKRSRYLAGEVGFSLRGLHLSEEEEADGFPITAVYGEQGAQVAGWLRRYEPELIAALHLAEALVRNPQALARLLQASGGGATEQVGCILARDGGA